MIEDHFPLATPDRMTARHMLQVIHDVFPLSEHMNADFKGSHAVKMDSEGNLFLEVWFGDKCHPVTMDESDEYDADALRIYLEEMKNF